jgi:hypothetical protein
MPLHLRRVAAAYGQVVLWLRNLTELTNKDFDVSPYTNKVSFCESDGQDFA